jgi:hypothetical protein
MALILCIDAVQTRTSSCRSGTFFRRQSPDPLREYEEGTCPGGVSAETQLR